MRPFLRISNDPFGPAGQRWQATTAQAEEIFDAAAGDAVEVMAEDIRQAAQSVGASQELVGTIDTVSAGVTPYVAVGDEATREEAERLEYGHLDETPKAIVRATIAQRGRFYGEVFESGLTRRLEESLRG